MSNDIAERVKKVRAVLLRVDELQVKDDSRFVEDLGAASIQSIELVAEYEEEFDIEMDQDEALAVKSVGDAVSFIEKTIAEQRGDGD